MKHPSSVFPLPEGGSSSPTGREKFGRQAAGASLCLVLCLLALSLPAAADIPPAIEDPTETVGPRACAQCHDAEHQVWLGTAHAELYESDEPLHERPRAKEIAGNLGKYLIKNDELCIDCHFTPTVRGSSVTAVAGVSCESCHGAAQDWIHEHNTWQGTQVSRAAESPTTTRARRARMAELGMRHPGDLYALLGACYTCHMVPDERLVMEGEHPSGSDFDPIERVDAIRHTFVTAGSRTEKAPLSDARKRQLHVLGAALELELRLRQIAAAESAQYARLLAASVPDTLRKLERIQRAQELPEVATILKAARGLSLEAGNRDELAYAAEKVAEAAHAFSRERDGTGLAALDRVLGGVSVAEGEAEPSLFAQLAAGDGENPEDSTEAGNRPPSADGGDPAESPDGTPSPSRAQQPEGEIRLQIREPLTDRQVVGPTPCSKCHQHRHHSARWRSNAHASSMIPFWNAEPRQVEIARTYYGRSGVDNLLIHKDSVCMSCHGTVPAGSVEADSGVSCESCHGPAGDYLESHDEVSRSQRLQLGMVDLEDLERRAEVCASCHYVNDRRLLSSGHPAGDDFDPVSRLREIEHWEGGQPTAGAWRSAYQEATAARGPVPRVRVVTQLPPPSRDTPGPTTNARGRSSRGGVSTTPATPGMPVPGAPPVDPRALAGSGASVDLPPWPEHEGLEEQPVEEILRQVQKRLEILYESIRESRP